MSDPLVIAGKTFRSRLIVGTGKYPSHAIMADAHRASGDRDGHGGGAAGEPDGPVDRSRCSTTSTATRIFILPNTAGCYTAEEAIRTARLGREVGLSNWVKLEVIGDEQTLFPDNVALLEATRVLVKEGFVVLPYTNDDPVVCRKLEDAGAAAVMPLGAPIGSGLGIQNPNNIRIIKDQARVPVIVDAGVGTASDAAIAMELGADGVLMNTAIALARDPVAMASAMKLAVEAGRLAFLAGRIARKEYASAEQPDRGAHHGRGGEMTDVPLEEALRRLKQERDEADRRLQRRPHPARSLHPPAAGHSGAGARTGRARRPRALNESWNILPDPPVMPGVKGRLAGFVWRIVAPYLQRQLTFNSLVVEHVNRNAEARRAAHRREGEARAAIRAQMHELAAFQGRLMLLLQQITAYVDTKDRDAAGGLLVLNTALNSLADSLSKHGESIKAREQRYEARTAAVAAGLDELRGTLDLDAQQKSIVALNTSLSGLTDAYAKYRESLEAREYRYEARTTAIAAAHEELRGIIGLNQQAIVALKRAVKSPPVRASAGAQIPESAGSTDVFAPSLDAYKYVAFEDQFRGSREEIRERFESYIPCFQHRSSQGAGESRPSGDVLDIGCGRGEFLDLLAAHGIAARGIDLNQEMAEVCRARGLNVVEADAVQYLTSLPDDSLGGIFAAQVVEHLEPSYLLLFLDVAFEKLQPGGRLVLETLNPACWTAFFESYIRDITHRWPLHPETLKYLVLASGFSRADIEFRSPVPPEDRLQAIAVPETADATMQELAEAFNSNVLKLNARMFTHMDYAIIGGKTGPVR